MKLESTRKKYIKPAEWYQILFKRKIINEIRLDCIKILSSLSKYSVELTKLIDAFRQAKLTKNEWKEFDGYVKRFSNRKIQQRIKATTDAIKGHEYD